MSRAIANGDNRILGAGQGTNLSTVTRIWDDGDFVGLGNKLPTTLSGVSVTVNGVPAAIYFISPGQINFQVNYRRCDYPGNGRRQDQQHAESADD